MTQFKVRGGVRPRRLFLEVQQRKRAVSRCPWCQRKAFIWKSLAVWECRKCSFVQAGQAYSL